LTKVDIASMAHSLEARAPFLDQRVADLAGRLPISLKMHGKSLKYILKRTFPEFFPPGLLERGKMGFGVPIDHWMRDELKPMLNDLLLTGRFAERGWIAPEAALRLYDEHQSHRWDHSARLWALLMLELWARNYLDTTAERPPVAQPLRATAAEPAPAS
jgi:asparagine synthase (glutamine-hydrolysing)